MGHDGECDVVLGVNLQGNGMGIIVLCFPMVNRFDIGPAPVAMQLGTLGIAWKNECVVGVLFLSNGCVPMHASVCISKVAV